MRRVPFIVAMLMLTTTANAQVADRLSRGLEPNAIDRSLRPPVTSASANALEQAERRRAQQAARDAAAQLGPPPGSTMIDGPAGVQRTGSGTSSPGNAAQGPPNAPQP